MKIPGLLQQNPARLVSLTTSLANGAEYLICARTQTSNIESSCVPYSAGMI
jgi:hypothetical protein